MTQPKLLELAKQGNPQAIADLMNRSLRPKGIEASVERVGNRLRVLITAEQIPNRQAMTTFVQNGITSLGIADLEAIEISGRQINSDNAWTQEVYLGTPVTTPVSPVAPPPPPRRLPVPPLVAPSEPAGLTLEDLDAATAPEAETPWTNGQTVTPIDPLETPNLTELPGEPAILDEPAVETRSTEPTIVEPIPAEPIAAEPEIPERPRRNASSIFVVAVLLLILGWVGAIVGFALWSNLTAPPRPAPAPVIPAPVTPASPTPSPQSAAPSYQEALNKGTQAQELAKSAQSADDWNLVVSQWQQAIDNLKAIPASSPDRAVAQTKLGEYQASLASAQQRAANQPAVNNVPPASSFTVSRDITCPTAAAASGSQVTNAQAIEISSVQFKAGPADQKRDSIVGCITNYTNQPIGEVSVSYQGRSAQDPNLIESGVSPLSFSNLAARRTVPFAGAFELSQKVTNLEIKAIYWTPLGAKEQQQIPASVALAR